jgi:hypothetical protein
VALALSPVGDPDSALEPVVPVAPPVAFCATSFTFVKLTFAPLTKAAMLDVPAVVPVPSTGASTSMSANATGCDTFTWSAATLPAGRLVGATTTFAPVYVQAAPPSPPGHATPPKSASPASSVGDATEIASAYVPAHAITR